MGIFSPIFCENISIIPLAQVQKTVRPGNFGKITKSSKSHGIATPGKKLANWNNLFSKCF
jgi:hypothetical protein